MVQNVTLKFNAPRKSDLTNLIQADLLRTGKYEGYEVVIDSGTVGAADTIKITKGTDSKNILMTREGVRIEETSTDITPSLSVTTADGSNPRVDIVAAQHTSSSSNNPQTYAVIAGTPAASPVAPALPADAVLLATIDVATSAGSITNTEIANERKVFDKEAIVVYVGSTHIADTATIEGAIDIINSNEARSATIVLLEDAIFTIALTRTTRIPIKVLGMVGVGLARPILNLRGAWTVEAPIATGQSALEFEGIDFRRTTTGGTLIFSGGARFKAVDCFIVDTAGGVTVPTFTSATVDGRFDFECERCVLTADLSGSPPNALFKFDADDQELFFVFKSCNIEAVDFDSLFERDNVNAGKLEIHLEDYTLIRSDGWDSGSFDLGAARSVHYDGTSLLFGRTGVPVDISVVHGDAFHTLRFSILQPTIQHEQVLEFYAGKVLNLAAEVFSLGAATTSHVTLTTPTHDNRTIRGSGRDATTLSMTMPTTAGQHAIDNVSAVDLRIEDLTLLATSSAGNATGSVFQNGAAAEVKFKNVKITATGGAAEIGKAIGGGGLISAIRIIVNGSGSGLWTEAVQISQGIAERCLISEFTEAGLLLATISTARACDINLGELTGGLKTGVFMITKCILSDSRIHGDNAPGAIAAAIGVTMVGDSTGDDPGCMCYNNFINGAENFGPFATIDNGILVKNDRNMLSNNIIVDCIDEGIVFDASTDECLANGNSITDCGGAALDDLGTDNAKTGNYSRGNGSGIDTPNKAGNIEI